MKKWIAHLWAALALFVVIFGFICKQQAVSCFVKIIHPHVSSRYTGGPVLRKIERKEYIFSVHKPVFEGIISERASGFIQIDVQPTGTSLPPLVTEYLDELNAMLIFNTKQNRLTILSQNPKILKGCRIYNLGKDKTIRIKISK
jgi:hypothetical protein